MRGPGRIKSLYIHDHGDGKFHDAGIERRYKIPRRMLWRIDCHAIGSGDILCYEVKTTELV